MANKVASRAKIKGSSSGRFRSALSTRPIIFMLRWPSHPRDAKAIPILGETRPLHFGAHSGQFPGVSSSSGTLGFARGAAFADFAARFDDVVTCAPLAGLGASSTDLVTSATACV